MRTVILIFLLTLIGVSFGIPCLSNNPITTVKKYVRALNHYNYSKASKLITSNYDSSLQKLKKWGEQQTTVQKKEYKKKKKVYHYTLKRKFTTEAEVVLKTEEEFYEVMVVFTLKKIDNKWFIDSNSE